MIKAFQIKITLDNTKPAIWRRILVESDTTFFKLHHIIQIAMGWANYHLFEFKIAGYRIGKISEEFADMGYGNDKLVDCEITKLSDLLSEEKENLKYEYDFGDSWKHTVTIEKIIETNYNVPVCIKGKLNCPPEDCGGVYGFYHLLKIISTKKNKEYKEMIEWLGGHYDPNEFDLASINNELLHLDDYIKEWNNSEE
jgi:hypothetical protein